MAASTSNSSTSLWPTNKDAYELRDIIGVGATAVVYEAFCPSRYERCAVKRISLEKWTSIDEFFKEILAMSNYKHENVVTYYTSFVVNDELWLILKLFEGGSLLDIIKHKMKEYNCKNGVLDEATIATVLKEVLKGLEYIHNNGQIHRDIKAGNILLGEDGSIQIADFGVAAWLSNGRDFSLQNTRHTFGNPCWMAPEIMEQDQGYNFKADIWSFGITAIEMATGTAPYFKHPPMKVLMLTFQNDPPNLDTGADSEDQYKAYGKTFRKMIADCLKKDPSQRPTATELLKHPFFKKAKDPNYLIQTLVAVGPSMAERVQTASKLKAGNLSKLHPTNTEELTWSKEEEEDGAASNVQASSQEDTRPMNHLQREDSSDSDDEPEPNSKTMTDFEMQMKDIPPVLNVVLRMRNPEGVLNDIRFEFIVNEDTTEGIASELVEAGLLNPLDTAVVNKNLATLLESRYKSSITPPDALTFHLNSAGPDAELDDDELIGFAKIYIVE